MWMTFLGLLLLVSPVTVDTVLEFEPLPIAVDIPAFVGWIHPTQMCAVTIHMDIDWHH